MLTLLARFGTFGTSGSADSSFRFFIQRCKRRKALSSPRSVVAWTCPSRCSLYCSMATSSQIRSVV